MSVLYLAEQGSVLSKQDQRFVVRKEGRVLAQVAAFNLERVLVFGNVQITTQAVAALLESGVETSFLSTHGKFRGRLAPAESKNVPLRMAQYRRHLDEPFKLAWAKRIVRAKIENAKGLLARYAYNHPEVPLEQARKDLDARAADVENRTAISSLMGTEGAAASVYFRAYGLAFRRELRFEGRERRPPKDPVNALLSLGYVMVTNEMLSCLSAHGFDPYVGYLHGLDYGRPSLALDLIEEFRHAIVDRLTLNLVNNQALTAPDFEDKGAEEGVRLQPEALKKYLLQYEKFLTHSAASPLLPGGQGSYRDLFHHQALAFGRCLQHEGPEIVYEPYRFEP